MRGLITENRIIPTCVNATDVLVFAGVLIFIVLGLFPSLIEEDVPETQPPVDFMLPSCLAQQGYALRHLGQEPQIGGTINPATLRCSGAPTNC